MTKGKSIFISILLVVASALLYLTLHDDLVKLDSELVAFFSVFAFVIGLFNVLRELIRVKKKESIANKE